MSEDVLALTAELSALIEQIREVRAQAQEWRTRSQFSKRMAESEAERSNQISRLEEARQMEGEAESLTEQMLALESRASRLRELLRKRGS